MHVRKSILLPLIARAVESKKANPVLFDQTAMEIAEKMNYNPDQMNATVPEMVRVACIGRDVCFDRLIKDFIRRYPKATIVNIGCGLDNTFERVNNGLILWFDLDLPHVIKLRKLYIKETENRRFISASFLDNNWYHYLNSPRHILFIAAGIFYYYEQKAIRNFVIRLSMLFPTCELLFDATSNAGFMAANRLLRRSGMSKNSPLKWGRNSVAILRWSSRFVLLGKYYSYRQNGIRLSFKNKILGWVSNAFDLHYMIHLRVKHNYRHIINYKRMNNMRKKLRIFLCGIIFVTGLLKAYSSVPENDFPGKTKPLNIHGFSQNFIRIPEGEFLMGSDEKPDEQPVHLVTISSFDMATTEVTVRQFRVFIQATQYTTDAEKDGHSFACCWRPKLGITWLNPGFLQGDDEPVVAISWNDAVAYCKWISDETGEEYRLPSEAEWEYVCSEGNNIDKTYDPEEIAWFSKNSSGRTHPVATRNCNSWGIYDLFGNAWEWTQDIYHENYIYAPTNGKAWLEGGSEAQRGYLKAGEGRVLRGGSWGLSNSVHPVSYDLRKTSRPVFGRDNSCNNSGFRIVRSIRKDFSPPFCTVSPENFLVNGINYQMVCLPPGNLIIGNGNQAHTVQFKKPVMIAENEITVRQFRNFAENTGYVTDAEKNGSCWDSDFRSHHTSIRQSGINWKNPGFLQSEEDPVTCISWNDAMAFCKWLSDVTGRRIRLPSESEWEYAGSDSTKSYYNAYSEIAWFYDNSDFVTHPCRGKKPNSKGIYDILGNVSEWTMDIWHPDFENAPDDGSSWLGDPLHARAIRGGSFERESSEISLQGRDWYDQSESIVGAGFRIVDACVN